MKRISLVDDLGNLYWHDYEDDQEAIKFENNFKDMKHFSNYTKEIKDLSLDVEFMVAKVNENRKKEYPNIDEVIEALLEVHEGRPEKLTEIMLKREAIKIKYPKGKNNGRVSNS